MNSFKSQCYVIEATEERTRQAYFSTFAKSTTMKKKNEESNNDVNEFPDSSNQNLTSGSWGLTLQDPLDRQSAIAVNAKTFRNKIQRIALWNIRTFHQKGKFDNVMLEMNRMRISCLGLFEVRWTGNGQAMDNLKKMIK